MTRTLTVSLFLMGLAAPATAGCFGPGISLFSCTFDGGQKQVNVCLQASVVLYSFGPTDGAPELLMGRDARGVHMTPWSGVGGSIWEEISLYSGGYSYNLSYAIDRAPEGAPTEGRLVVGRGDSEVAELVCDRGSVKTSDFYPLFEAKEAAGQMFCRTTFQWADRC